MRNRHRLGAAGSVVALAVAAVAAGPGVAEAVNRQIGPPGCNTTIGPEQRPGPTVAFSAAIACPNGSFVVLRVGLAFNGQEYATSSPATGTIVGTGVQVPCLVGIHNGFIDYEVTYPNGLRFAQVERTPPVRFDC